MKGMKVRDLIELLQRHDPDQEVYTIDSCDCCTSFEAVEAKQVGVRDVDTDERFSGEAHYFDEEEVVQFETMKKPALVIAGGTWASWPSPEDLAIRPIHDLELIREIRKQKERDES